MGAYSRGLKIYFGSLLQGLKMSGSGAARKLLPENPHRKSVTISQEIFRVNLQCCVNDLTNN